MSSNRVYNIGVGLCMLGLAACSSVEGKSVNTSVVEVCEGIKQAVATLTPLKPSLNETQVKTVDAVIDLADPLCRKAYTPEGVTDPAALAALRAEYGRLLLVNP